MLSIRNAFKNHGIKALFHGRLATVLPVDQDMEAQLDQKGSSVSTPARAGQLMVAWKKNGKPRGAIIDADQSDGLDFIFDRTDGTCEMICAGDSMAGAALEISHMEKENRQNPGDFVKEAFKSAGRLLRCVQDCIAAKMERFSGINNKMRKALLAGGTAVSMLAMAGCQTTTAAPRILIDGPVRGDVYYDLNECKQLAQSHTAGNGAIAGKAVSGAIFGAMFKGILDDSARDLGRTAAIGALGGILYGAEEKRQNREAIALNCMRSRGHNALDVDLGI